MKMQNVSFGNLNVVLRPNMQYDKNVYNDTIKALRLNKVDDKTDIITEKDYAENHNSKGKGFDFKSSAKTENLIFDILKAQGIEVSKSHKRPLLKKESFEIDNLKLIEAMNNEESFEMLAALDNEEILF